MIYPVPPCHRSWRKMIVSPCFKNTRTRVELVVLCLVVHVNFLVRAYLAIFVLAREDARVASLRAEVHAREEGLEARSVD